MNEAKINSSKDQKIIVNERLEKEEQIHKLLMESNTTDLRDIKKTMIEMVAD